MKPSIRHTLAAGSFAALIALVGGATLYRIEAAHQHAAAARAAYVDAERLDLAQLHAKERAEGAAAERAAEAAQAQADAAYANSPEARALKRLDDEDEAEWRRKHHLTSSATSAPIAGAADNQP